MACELDLRNQGVLLIYPMRQAPLELQAVTTGV
jgi:hypothetical protein